MPLYEYLCRRCSRRFEALVMGSTAPACPECRGADLEKLVSTFAVGGARAAADGDADYGDAADGPAPCGSCGDPRGPGSCAVD